MHNKIMNVTRSRSTTGFTLVEIIVVIAVIGILATISVVGYGNWRKSVATAQVKSDLNGVISAMENARTFNNLYPVTIPNTITASNGVTLSGGGSIDGKSYCVDGASVTSPTVTYYVDSSSSSQGVQQGTCLAAPPPAAPSGLAVVSAASTVINLSWTAVPGATGYTAQCARDTAYTVGMQQYTSTTTTTTGSVTGLNNSSLYYCRVKATNTNGSSGWSVNVTTTTAAPDPIVAHTQAFSASGTFTVPATTTSVTLEAWGGIDGLGDWGGYAKGTLAVTAGDVLTVTITASYSDQGGYAQITRAGTNAIIATGGWDDGDYYDCGYGYTYAGITAPLTSGCYNGGVPHALFTYNTGLGY